MNPVLLPLAEYARESANAFEAQVKDLRSRGLDEQAIGLMFAVLQHRTDAKVFEAMAERGNVGNVVPIRGRA